MKPHNCWWIALTLTRVSCAAAFGVSFAPGNILVANGDKVTEYTRGGAVVKRVAVPSPTPLITDDLIVRDVVLDRENRLHVMTFPGTFLATSQAYLSTLDLESALWTHATMDGWSLASVTYYGGIGIDDHYLFLPDQETGGGANDGLIRFPLADLTVPERFHEVEFGDHLWHQATVGLDGFLYMLARGPGLDNLVRFDPDTLENVDQFAVHVGSSVTGVAVDENGHIYTVDLDNDLHHFDSTGTLLATIPVSGGTDLELARDGTLLVGGAGGTLTVTHTSDLATQLVIDTSEQDRGDPFDHNFVTFAAPLLVPGDTNGDGLVDIDDLNSVRNNFGAIGPDDGTLDGDTYPFDGAVDVDDLNAVRNHFGTTAAVCEPSSLVLASLFALVALITRRRRRV